MVAGAENASPREELTPSQMSFVLAQMQAANEGFRLSVTLTVQLITVFVVANASVVGYTITSKVAGVLLIGAIFPLAIIFTINTIARLNKALLVTGAAIEQRYGPAGLPLMVGTYVGNMISPEYAEEVKAIAALPDPKERQTRLNRLRLPVVGSTGRGWGRAALVLMSVAEIAVALGLSVFLDWRLL